MAFTLRMALLTSTLGVGACLQVQDEPRPGDGGVNSIDATVADAPIKLDAPVPTITLVPTSRPALDEFLLQRKYLGFAGESRGHQSEGTHDGVVRTFMNPLLFNSLAANNREHPQGAAAVKEIYKGAQQLVGWAVLVKVAAQGNVGDGYFWFEALDGRVTAQGTGLPTCAQCHEVGRDLVLTRLPLR